MTTTVTRKPDISTDIFGTTLTINFSNGNELSLDATKLSEEIRLAAMLHGLKQKLCDGGAIPRNTETGRSATIDDKYTAIHAIYTRLISPDGTWNANREGEQKQQGGMFLRAMMSITGKSHEVMKAALEAMSKEQIAALKKNPKIIDKMRELEALAVRPDAIAASDALLAGLMSGGSDEVSEA